MKNFLKKNNSGMSLVETMIIFVVIAILIAVAIPSLSKIKKMQVLKNAGSDIVAILGKARAQTLASLNSSGYGVHFQSDKITLFKGSSFSESDANNEEINIVAPAIISDISLSGGGSEIYFSRLTGMPSKTGTIAVSITGDASMSKIITISAVGTGSMN